MAISTWISLVIGLGMLGSASRARADLPPSAPGAHASAPPPSSDAPVQPAPSWAPGPPYVAPVGWSASEPATKASTARPSAVWVNPHTDSEVPTERLWYGWQTLLVYGASASLLAVGTVAEDFSPKFTAVGVISGLAGLTLGGPIIHWAHGSVGGGFGALGLYLGAPVVAGLGLGLLGCSATLCSPLVTAGSLIVGAGAGSLTALIIDVSMLSYSKHRPDASVGARATTRATLVPSLELQRDRAAIGLMGTF